MSGSMCNTKNDLKKLFLDVIFIKPIMPGFKTRPLIPN